MIYVTSIHSKLEYISKILFFEFLKNILQMKMLGILPLDSHLSKIVYLKSY